MQLNLVIWEGRCFLLDAPHLQWTVVKKEMLFTMDCIDRRWFVQLFLTIRLGWGSLFR